MERIKNDVSEPKINEEWCEIPEGKIQLVLESLTEFWPESLNIYNFITENLKLCGKSGRAKTRLFRNNGNGLLIAVTQGLYRRAVVFSSDRNYSGIESALNNVNFINWNNGSIIFCGTPLNLFEHLKEVSQKIGKRLTWRGDIFDCYWMSAESAKTIEVECPEDMYFSKLEDIHADTVNTTWRYGRNDTLGMVRDIIKFMDTVGLFTKKDSKLVSWVLNTVYGVGMLYTVEEYRKKGYGTLVVKKLAKILGQSDINPILVTLQDNLAAKAVFCKIGFVFIEPLKYFSMEQD